MPPRAYWKGYLRLSLVTIGVELYSAVTAGGRRLSLHQIHRPSGKRVRHQNVVPGVGPVDADEIVKGYEFDDDEYVLIEPDELDNIKLDTKHTIELVQFVDHCEIDPRYYEKPYYVVPVDDDVAAEGFAVINAALQKSKKVALGQMAVRGRDYVVAIMSCGEGLLLETLRYAEEIRESDKIFNDVPDVEVDRDMLGLAQELVERKSAPFHPEAFKSQYMKALRALIEEKRKSGAVAEDTSSAPERGDGNVVNLMDALKKSLSNDKGRGKTSAAKKKSPARKSRKRAAG